MGDICERMFKLMGFHELRSVDLAKKLGIPQNTVSNWGSRNTDPPAKFIIPICEFLECTPLFLLTGDESNPPEPWITDMDKEVIFLFRKLCYEDRKRFLSLLEDGEMKKELTQEMTPDELEMLEAFRALSYREQQRAISRLQTLVEVSKDEGPQKATGAQQSGVKAV